MSYAYFEFPDYTRVDITHTDNIYYYVRRVIHNLHNISKYFPVYNASTYVVNREDNPEEVSSIHAELVKDIGTLCIGGTKEFRDELTGIINKLYSQHENQILNGTPVATRCFKLSKPSDGWTDTKKFELYSYYKITDDSIVEYLTRFSHLSSAVLQEAADYVINDLDEFFLSHKSEPFESIKSQLYDILSKVGNIINKMNYIAEAVFLLEHMFYNDLDNSISEVPHMVTEYKSITIRLENASHLLFTSNYHNGTFSRNIKELRRGVEMIGDMIYDSTSGFVKNSPIAFIKNSTYHEGIDICDTIRNDPVLGISVHMGDFQNIYDEFDFRDKCDEYDYFSARMVD